MIAKCYLLLGGTRRVKGIVPILRQHRFILRSIYGAHCGKAVGKIRHNKRQNRRDVHGGAAAARRIRHQLFDLEGVDRFSAFCHSQCGSIIVCAGRIQQYLPFFQRLIRSHGGIIVSKRDKVQLHNFAIIVQIGVCTVHLKGRIRQRTGDGSIAIVNNVDRGSVIGGDNRFHLCAVGVHRRQVDHPHHRIHVPRVAAEDHILCAEIQASGRGQDHQHHRGEDADGSKPCAVALHAICHRGNGDKMVGAIIVSLTFLQNAAQHDRACDKQQICADDDKQHRKEKPAECRDGILDGDGNVISKCQNADAEDAAHPVGAQRLFADIFTVQKG